MRTDRIEVNPNVMLGKPVVKGTRIPVELVLRKLGEGGTMDDLRDAYPRLTPEDVCACLVYAADTVATRQGDGSANVTSMLLPIGASSSGA